MIIFVLHVINNTNMHFMGNYISNSSESTHPVEPAEINDDTPKQRIIKYLMTGEYNDAYKEICSEQIYDYDILVCSIENSVKVAEELAMTVIVKLFTEKKDLCLEISKNWMDIFKIINNNIFLKTHFKKNLLKHIIRKIDNKDFTKMIFISALEMKAVKCVKLLTNYYEMYTNTVNLRQEEWVYYLYDKEKTQFVKISEDESTKLLPDKLVIKVSEIPDWKQYVFKNTKLENDGKSARDSISEELDTLEALQVHDNNSIYVNVCSK